MLKQSLDSTMGWYGLSVEEGSMVNPPTAVSGFGRLELPHCLLEIPLRSFLVDDR